MGDSVPRRGRWAFGLTVVALAWSLLFFAAAFVYPFYAGDSCTGDRTGTTCTDTSATLVEVNGAGGAIVAALPVVLVAVAGAGLRRRYATASVSGTRIAVGAAVLLGLLALLGAASIGLFVAPSAIAVSVAVALTPSSTAGGRTTR